jgi:hypothetical protein
VFEVRANREGHVKLGFTTVDRNLCGVYLDVKDNLTGLYGTSVWVSVSTLHGIRIDLTPILFSGMSWSIFRRCETPSSYFT